MSLVLEDVRLQRPGFDLAVSVRMDGPLTGLTGPSGAGKTTLLEIMAGVQRPDHGRIELNGEVLTDTAGHLHVPPRRRGVGYVPQDLALFPHLKVRANLFFSPGAWTERRGLAQRVVEVLELGALLDRPVPDLSGGERQRVALGRALLAAPRILLLDEPLASLDDRLKERILPCLQAIPREFGVPLLYVSHSRAELTRLCPEQWYLESGRMRLPPVRGDLAEREKGTGIPEDRTAGEM